MNRYEVHFENDKIGDADDFTKAMDIATEVLEVIKQNPIKEDDYQLLQIHCYWWWDRLFNSKKYSIIVWSEKEKTFKALK
jgi:hypothetical protein